MNNRSAFPWTVDDGETVKGEKGMTLRDYFAAKAMQAFLDEVSSKSGQEWFDQIAKNAYRMADTMMKARGE